MFLIRISALMMFFMSASAFARSTVCAGEKLFYSEVRFDGKVNGPAEQAGKVVIVHDGKVLLTYPIITGLRPQGSPSYDVRLVGEEQVLEDAGTLVPGAGSKVYKQTAVLVHQKDPFNKGSAVEVARENVVCREMW